MEVTVVAVAGDAIAQELTRRLAARGNTNAPGPADLSLGTGSRLRMDAHGIELDGRSLSRCDAVFVRGFTYMDPVVPSPLDDADWSIWQAGYMVEQQRFSTQYSVLQELTRRGVEVINPPEAHLRCFQRAEMLNHLGASGVATPPLLCTNDPAAAEAFAARHGTVLWRPASGRATWQTFTDRQKEHFVAPGRPPITLAGVAEGGLVRCWLLRGEPLLCLAHAPADATGLERLEAWWSVDPAEAGAAALEPVGRLIGAPWVQVTYVFDGRNVVVYDVDTDPRLEWLPPDYLGYLIERLADGLAGTAVAGACPRGGRERPTPLLRRMLRDLFDYEASKYPASGAP